MAIDSTIATISAAADRTKSMRLMRNLPLLGGSRLHHWLPPSQVPYIQDEVLSLYLSLLSIVTRCIVQHMMQMDYFSASIHRVAEKGYSRQLGGVEERAGIS